MSVGKVVVFFGSLLQYLAKNMPLLVQQNFGIFCKNLFSAILQLKKNKLDGGDWEWQISSNSSSSMLTGSVAAPLKIEIYWKI